MTDTWSALRLALADRYRVERELGRGGMATVYLAKDLKHDRDVAIKVLHQDLGAALGAERFLAEIRTTARLQHPHILPLLDSGEVDGLLYYVMPYVSGESLRDRLTRERQLPIDDAVRIAREVADALGEAHAHGIVHRDIKPENILLRGGHALVADFGIALAVSAAAGGRITESGFTLGTPRYMSPEQATAEKEITSRSDIYSLGCVLYEMLTGNPPHTGATAQQIIMKVVTEEPVSAAKLRKAVPPNVSAAVAQALEKIPADRFENAKAFADALANPTYATLRGVAPGIAVRERRWSRDPRSIGTAAVAAVSGVALVWALVRQTPAVYDIGLPYGTAMTTEQGTGFAVSPSGDFIVYQAERVPGSVGALWHRSLRDSTVRRIAGTDGASHPAISPNGSRLAFLRFGAGNAWTLEWMPIEGGSPSIVGHGVGYADLAWTTDDKLQAVVPHDMGSEVRWFDAAGGHDSTRKIGNCLLPSLMPGGRRLLCGGARGPNFAHFVGIADGESAFVSLVTAAGYSAFQSGSHFRIIDGHYLVYLSMDGDLLAARIDTATRRIGRSVRFVNGIARQGDTGAGAYDLSKAGTLVYAQGANHGVGSLVAMDEHGAEALDVGQNLFVHFAPSPDGTRLAAVVWVADHSELRVYDLRSGSSSVRDSDFVLEEAVWNHRGDSLLFGTRADLYAGSPEQSAPPGRVHHFKGDGFFEPFAWDADGRAIVEDWDGRRILSLDLKDTLHSVKEIANDAGFPSLSPDGRWISYKSSSGVLFVQPMSASGKRYPVAQGDIKSARWLSPTELTVAFRDSSSMMWVDRIAIDFSGPSPIPHHRHWLTLPDFVETAGPSYTLMPDGRVLYLRGAPERPVSYLRVVPGWVSKMEHAVDEANR